MATFKTTSSQFFLWFGDQPGREKITFGDGEAGVHYTIIFKGDKRVLDIHKTIELSDSNKRYEQILEIGWFTLRRFIVACNNINIYLLRKYWLDTRINLGKLGHHNLVLFPLVPDDSKVDIFIDNKRKKKIRLRKEISVNQFLELFLYHDEVPYSNQKSFLVYSSKKGILKLQGLVFRLEGDKRTRSFYFVSCKRLNKFIRANQSAILDILHGIDFTNKREVMTQLNSAINRH